MNHKFPGNFNKLKSHHSSLQGNFKMYYKIATFKQTL